MVDRKIFVSGETENMIYDWMGAEPIVTFKLGFSQFYDTDPTVYTTSKIEKRKEMWVKLGEKEILIGMHISRRRRGGSKARGDSSMGPYLIWDIDFRAKSD